MTETEPQATDDLTLLAAGTILLRNRWLIARYMLIGAVLAATFVFTKPVRYSAFASFLPQGNDASRSGLASLAGQLGVNLTAGNQSMSSEFYARLLQSPALLRHIARDTVVVPELGGTRVAILDLYDIRGENKHVREERGVKLLAKIVKSSFSKTTGIVDVSVVTKWPSVSEAIATLLLAGVNEFNLRSRQEQAAAERNFVEKRVGLAGVELRVAEDRLESFLQNNRQYASSPELTFQRERLQREISLKQQVFNSLTQTFEEVRIREVRDTPTISVIELPTLPTQPEARWRLQGTLLGFVIGAFLGAIIAVVSDTLRLRRRRGEGEVNLFFSALSEVRGELLGLIHVLWNRARRPEG